MSKSCRARDRRVSVAERAIVGQGFGEQVIVEQENFGPSDLGVIEKKNTVRNE